MSEDDRILDSVEDVLLHGPFERFQRVSYHGCMYEVGGELGRILNVDPPDEDLRGAKVDFNGRVLNVSLLNLRRVP